LAYRRGYWGSWKRKLIRVARAKEDFPVDSLKLFRVGSIKTVKLLDLSAATQIPVETLTERRAGWSRPLLYSAQEPALLHSFAPAAVGKAGAIGHR